MAHQNRRLCRSLDSVNVSKHRSLKEGNSAARSLPGQVQAAGFTGWEQNPVTGLSRGAPSTRPARHPMSPTGCPRTMTSSVRKMTDFLRCPARCATTGRRSRRTRAASQLRCQHGELATWHGATGGRSRPAKAAGTRVPYLLAWRLTSGGMGFTLALGNMRGHEATTPHVQSGAIWCKGRLLLARCRAPWNRDLRATENLAYLA